VADAAAAEALGTRVAQQLVARGGGAYIAGAAP
jgi:hypothetical protein